MLRKISTIVVFVLLVFVACKSNSDDHIQNTSAYTTETIATIISPEDAVSIITSISEVQITTSTVNTPVTSSTSAVNTETIMTAPANTVASVTSTTATSVIEPTIAQTPQNEGGVNFVIDMVMTINHPSGVISGRYTGEIVDDMPNGKGTFDGKRSTGETWSYQGDFLNGNFEGEGAITWENGSSEEGSYENGVLNGIGKQFTNDELQYEGSFVNNERDGFGKLYSDGEIVFEGLFSNGIPEEKPFKEQCQMIKFDDAVRRPEYFDGRPVTITGKILQVVELGDGKADYRVVTGSKNKEAFYVAYDRQKGESRLLEDDEVTVWGICKGMINYKTTIGNIATLPGILVYYVQID